MNAPTQYFGEQQIHSPQHVTPQMAPQMPPQMPQMAAPPGSHNHNIPSYPPTVPAAAGFQSLVIDPTQVQGSQQTQQGLQGASPQYPPSAAAAAPSAEHPAPAPAATASLSEALISSQQATSPHHYSRHTVCSGPYSRQLRQLTRLSLNGATHCGSLLRYQRTRATGSIVGCLRCRHANSIGSLLADLIGSPQLLAPHS